MSCANTSKALRAGLLLASLSLAGCAGVPRAELGAYQNSFDGVTTAAEDLYLRAGLLAEKKADSKDSSASMAERRRELDARKSALAARLAALDLVERYNRMLTALASGTKPEDLKNQANALGDELSAFNLTEVNSLLARASPMLGVLAQGTALVEDAVKKKKFRQAVIEAQKPLLGILDVLIEDSKDLEELFVSELKLSQDVYRKQSDSAGSRFHRRIKGLKQADSVMGAMARHNGIRQQWTRDNVQLISYKEPAAAAEPTAGDLEELASISDQAETSILEYNKLEERVLAQRAVFDQYRKALHSTKKAFAALPSAVEGTRAVATRNFVQQARELRKATLMLQEAR